MKTSAFTNLRMFPRLVVAGSRASNASVKQKHCTEIPSYKCLAGLVAIAISFLNANVQAQSAQWIKQQGTGGISNGVSSDALQNTYSTGMVSDPGLFDNLTIPCHASDVFVAKYDPTGELIWAKTAGGALLDQGYDIATDPTGNSYVVGVIQTNGIMATTIGSSRSTTLTAPFSGQKTVAERKATWLTASLWTTPELSMSPDSSAAR